MQNIYGLKLFLTPLFLNLLHSNSSIQPPPPPTATADSSSHRRLLQPPPPPSRYLLEASNPLAIYLMYFIIAMEQFPQRELFGGAITTNFPVWFEDVSNIREVPDHQEVFVDPGRDESLIIELLEMKDDVADNGSGTWFLQDLATEQGAEGNIVTEQSAVFEAQGLGYRNMPSVLTTATAQMSISKGRQGREAQNLVKVYLANLRLKGVRTDVLITAYEPVFISPLSESANSVGAGKTVPAGDSGRTPMADVFKQMVSTFRINDWNLFGAAAL